MTAYCPECGAANTSADIFCGSCGASLRSTVPAPDGLPAGEGPPAVEHQVPDVFPQAASNSSFALKMDKRLAGWLIVFAVVAAGVPLTWHYLLTETKIETTYESVPFEIDRTEDEMLLKGIEYTRSPGMNGSMQVKTKLWVEDGVTTGRKIVSERIVQPPVNEVVVSGARTMTEAADDTRSVATAYFESWKAGDHSAMLSACSEESFSGYTPERITAAFQVTGEVLESYQVGTPVVVSMDDLIAEQKSSSWSYSNEEEDAMAPQDFPSGSLVVAEIPVTYTTNSTVQGRYTHFEDIRLAYVDGGWKVVYFGPVAAVAVNQSQRIVEDGYSEDRIMDVAVDFVVIYADHVIIAVHETNSTISRYGGSSLSSYFDSLPTYSYSSDDSFLTDDSTSSLTYLVDDEKSTDFEYSVKEGTTQSGFLYVKPGVPSEARTISMLFEGSYSSDDDVSFNGIVIQ